MLALFIGGLITNYVGKFTHIHLIYCTGVGEGVGEGEEEKENDDENLLENVEREREGGERERMGGGGREGNGDSYGSQQM